MGSSPPTTGFSQVQPRTLGDLSPDAFACCTSFLSVRDVCSLSMSSKSLRLHANSDAVWFRLFRDSWPNYCISSGAGGARFEYIARQTALRQFKYSDPMVARFFTLAVPASQILFAKDYVYMSQSLTKECRLSEQMKVARPQWEYHAKWPRQGDPPMFSLVSMRLNTRLNEFELPGESNRYAIPLYNKKSTYLAHITAKMKVVWLSTAAWLIFFAMIRDTRLVWSAKNCSKVLAHACLGSAENCLKGQHAVRFHFRCASPFTGSYEVLRGHNARITCMRLFPISETSFFRGEVQEEDAILATSSSDHTIRLWWKGQPQRCFKGHTGPVNVLVDSLLGVSGRKLLASGGEDCTVRLWSVGSERGHRHMVMTYHGHERSVSFLSVAGHKTSLLVSMSRDSRVRVWDTGASSSTGVSSCVGRTSIPGSPVSMKCYDSLCYVAAGTTVTAVDLRTMRSVATVALHSPKIYSFDMLPAKWLLCTGGEDKAILWDIRKNQTKPYPVAELEGHSGPVKRLHMDSYKVVTGGPSDNHINVWETDTGHLANVLQAVDPLATFSSSEKSLGFSALAVDGCRLVTSDADQGFITVRDFSECSIPIFASPSFVGSKFWESQNYSDD